MPGLKRAAVIAVAILVMLGVGILAVRGLGSPAALGSPSPSGSPILAPGISGSPSPSGAPGTPVPSDQMVAAFSEIERQVEALRGLPAADIGPPEILTRAQVADELQRIFDQDYPADERRRDTIALRAMGLLTAEQDAAELQLQLLQGQVLGFYDDTERRMVVVSDQGLTAEARFTYAHEYTHALQDAAFGLSSLQIDAEGQDDRALARLSLQEGDAVNVMFNWALAGGLTPDELLELFQQPTPSTEGIPGWMADSLLFPYEAGFAWTQSVWDQGGSAAVDAAFEDPPDTTEQVIHFDKWLDREPAVPVTAPDLAGTLGSGWEEVDNTPIGEASIRITLEYFGIPTAEAAAAAAGWGGDRVVVASGPDGAFALAWLLSWDSAADADQFAVAYERVAADLPFPASVTRLAGGEVLVAHASTDALLRSTIAAAGG